MTLLVAVCALIPPPAYLGFAATPTGWSVISVAHAYKVEKICEEITNKNGKQEKCRTVLVKQDASPKKEEKKAEEKKPAGHH